MRHGQFLLIFRGFAFLPGVVGNFGFLGFLVYFIFLLVSFFFVIIFAIFRDHGATKIACPFSNPKSMVPRGGKL